MRELPKFYLVTMLAAARRELEVVGSELVRRGLLESPEDLFFLDLHEARAALDGAQLSDLVRSRRSDYEWELRRRHVPRVLLSDGTEPEATAEPSAHADGTLFGVPASAGAVTGTAAVVLDPQTARLESGQILVCPSTDPGWTPLFLTAGGLVMEMGGANSHGAVVAREYGIPAVSPSLSTTTEPSGSPPGTRSRWTGWPARSRCRDLMGHASRTPRATRRSSVPNTSRTPPNVV